MMSAGTVALAWSPHHGGQDHQHTDIYAYCNDFRYDQRGPGDHRDASERARRDCVGRVEPVYIGPDNRRRS